MSLALVILEPFPDAAALIERWPYFVEAGCCWAKVFKS